MRLRHGLRQYSILRHRGDGTTSMQSIPARTVVRFFPTMPPSDFGRFPLHLPRGQRGHDANVFSMLHVYAYVYTSSFANTSLHSHTPRVQLYTQISPITE